MSWECERHVPAPRDTFYRAINVDAPPEVVWRWLCQMRLAPYSYDWIDNMGRQSPRELQPGIERLAIGQRIVIIFQIVDFVTGQQVTIQIRPRLRWFWGNVVCTYRVVENDSGGSRLFFIFSAPDQPGRFGDVTRLWHLRRYTFPWGELFMVHKQLRTFKMLAETQALEERAAATRNPARDLVA